MSSLKRLFWFVTCTVGALGLASSWGAERDRLSFEERVRAQEAIERVYYSHQIGVTKPFEEAVPSYVIESKVRTYLGQSYALAELWNRPISAEMLREELDRISRNTRFPDRLRQIFETLDNDSYLIRETFVRATLTDRLARESVAADDRIQGPARREAVELRKSLASGRLSAMTPHPGRNVLKLSRRAAEAGKPLKAPLRIGEVGAIVERPESYSIQVVLERSPERVEVASYEIPRVTWDSWWMENEDSFEASRLQVIDSEPLGGTVEPDKVLQLPVPSTTEEEGWTAMSTVGAPLRRHLHTAVWTGDYLIIWGGYVCDDTFFCVNLNSGGRYDPLTDTWTPTPITSGLASRILHTAVWTGSEMIVWGGDDFMGEPLNSGERYDPLRNTWTPTSMVNAPEEGWRGGRSQHTAVWTGSEMIVWGGGDDFVLFSTGGRYDPVSDRWLRTSVVNAPQGRYKHTAVWTGSRMLVWGGQASKNLNSGGSYDPGSDSWETLPTVQAPLARYGHTAVWTGSEMIVWGGDLTEYPPRPSYTDSGGAFDPASFSWRQISIVNAPSPRLVATAVWTGERMIIWGGNHIPGIYFNTGGRYDPISDCWAPTTTTNAPTGRAGRTGVWTGEEMIVWGGYGLGDLNTGARYLPGRADACGGQANQPPQAVAGADQSFECASHLGTSVSLDGTLSTDPDGDPLSYTWTGPFPEGGGLVEGPSPTVTLSLGPSVITLTVDDVQGHASTDDVTITVQDTLAPAMSLAPIPATLWPPNHRMVPVQMTAAAQDLCDGPSSVALVSVTGSEPDDAPGGGDGATVNDIQDVDVGSPDFEIFLRAERDGTGPGRIYTLIYSATDASGNSAAASSFITVPHDQNGVTEPVDISVSEPPGGTLVEWTDVPGARFYNVVKGDVGDLRETTDWIELGEVQCIKSGSTDVSTLGREDTSVPVAGRAWFYLVEYFDGWASSYGSEPIPKPRVPASGGCSYP